MTCPDPYRPDPGLDLVLERTIDVRAEALWLAWTTPEHLVQWFTPAPWQTAGCEMDLRPGGIFRIVMRSPEGEEFPYVGCFLEIVPGRRLVWTSALLPGFRPAVQSRAEGHECSELLFTAVICLEPAGSATCYTVVVMHRDPEERRRHEEMGFYEGWGKALDQLVAVAGKL